MFLKFDNFEQRWICYRSNIWFVDAFNFWNSLSSTGYSYLCFNDWLELVVFQVLIAISCVPFLFWFISPAYNYLFPIQRNQNIINSLEQFESASI